MKYMRRYLDYLEKYLDYERKRLERSDTPDAEWKARHVCSCKVKDVMKKKFDEMHQAFKSVDKKALPLLAGLIGPGCDLDWPTCASERRLLRTLKKK